tara:strand:- start:2105 stop:2368 length:264 start_codon:yes stop_codon:yes gene_type:complete
MSIDKTGFKYQASNIIAWIGFIYTASFWFLGGLDTTGLEVYSVGKALYPDGLGFFVAFGLYPCCALINYLVVGSPRLLPWKDIEDQE